MPRRARAKRTTRIPCEQGPREVERSAMTQTTPDAPVRRQRAQIKVRTLRTDRWWLAPLLTFLALSAFLVYGVWAIIDGSYYIDPYIAPFSSPCLTTSCAEGARLFGWA